MTGNTPTISFPADGGSATGTTSTPIITFPFSPPDVESVTDTTTQTVVISAATSPSLITAAPTAGASHKPSTSSTGARIGGLCSGVLILAVLAFLLLRRRRRPSAGQLRIPPELAPAPFAHMSAENRLYPATRSATARARVNIPEANAVQHKTREYSGIRHYASAPESVVATAGSQSTDEKQSTRTVPPREENGVDASAPLEESSREALLAQEVVALRMRIRVMEGLNNESLGNRRASASESDAPPDYEDAGIPL